jgi:hypothetical protein
MSVTLAQARKLDLIEATRQLKHFCWGFHLGPKKLRMCEAGENEGKALGESGELWSWRSCGRIATIAYSREQPLM